jgi:putative transposase
LPILTGEIARSILLIAWTDVQRRFPFRMDAVVVLPNHIHCIWTLPENETNFSMRWKEIEPQ